MLQMVVNYLHGLLFFLGHPQNIVARELACQFWVVATDVFANSGNQFVVGLASHYLSTFTI